MNETKHKSNDLIKILDAQKHLTFYNIMNYPVPNNHKQFYFWKNKTNKQTNNKKTKDNYIENSKNFSRKEKNPYMKDFLKKIDKYQKLYKSIPFVRDIYLCNSISFNALHKNSDIDLFIVTKENALWRARFFSRLFFTLKKEKLFLKKGKRGEESAQKFCLSFYTTENNQNLYPICIEQNDIYLAYRLAHLVPLYQEQKKQDSSYIYSKNNRIYSILPNLTKTHSIHIWNKKITGKTKIKQILELFFWWIIWKIFEKIIKWIRLPIVIRKRNKLGKANRGIIINDNMLKFHLDKRKKIHYLFQIKNKDYQ